MWTPLIFLLLHLTSRVVPATNPTSSDSAPLPGDPAHSSNNPAPLSNNPAPLSNEPSDGLKTLSLRMPNVTTEVHDSYLVTVAKVDYDDAYIVKYVPKASAVKVHHLLIYGCTTPARSDAEYWVVGDMGGICKWNSKVNTILWAWALDAPEFQLPENVGFHVGKNAGIYYIALELHYKNVISEPDASGVDVIMTLEAPSRLAGIYLNVAIEAVMPPHTTVNVDMTCTYDEEESIIPFAFRTHTHKLGVSVSSWREREGDWTLLGTGDPQKPQMFYLMEGDSHPIEQGDIIHSRCVYHSERETTTRIGSTGADEMCNFYMMYHMDTAHFRLLDGCFHQQKFTVPEYARIPEEAPAPPPKYVLDKTWTSPLRNGLGQVGGLEHTPDSKQLIIFHRAGNVWDEHSFDMNEVLVDKTNFIVDDVIVFLDPKTGTVLKSLGGGYFILPHGVYMDHHRNLYLVDVGLHQVFRFPENASEPDLVLGTRFVPGSDSTHFCKPTNVVVDVDNNIYVSDGYCNARVVKFNSNGEFIAEFVSTLGKAGKMFVVHDLSINPADGLIYVADRENGQIHTMTLDGEFIAVHQLPGRIFAIDYVPETHTLYAVNVTGPDGPSKVMLVNPDTGEISAVYPEGPDSPFQLPHALTYIAGTGIFVGEYSEPPTVWKLVETSHDSEERTEIFGIIAHNIPLSFIAVIGVLALIPIIYLAVVLVVKCRGGSTGSKTDRNGFQKLLRDYESSDDEEELVYKNRKIYR